MLVFDSHILTFCSTISRIKYTGKFCWNDKYKYLLVCNVAPAFTYKIHFAVIYFDKDAHSADTMKIIIFADCWRITRRHQKVILIASEWIWARMRMCSAYHINAWCLHLFLHHLTCQISVTHSHVDFSWKLSSKIKKKND